jgi:tetratricopeptide (TPR) repeat protein
LNPMDAEQTGGVREAFENARALLAARRPARAIEQLLAILEAQPDEVNALCLLGTLRCEQGQVDEAIALLKRAHAAAPGFHQAGLELARVLRIADRLDEAIAVLEALTRRVPDLSAAWLQLGDALCQNRRFSEGRAAFRKAAETDPHRAKVASAIKALTQLRQRDAEETLRSILVDEPNHVHATIGLATLALDAGVTADAERLLEHARRLSPHSDVVWRNIARLHNERADFDAAIKAANRAVEVGPDQADSWSMLGSVQASGLRPAEARISYEKAIELKPGQPRVWLSLGHVLKTIGARDQSEAAYQKAIDQDAGLGEAYWSLADLKTYRFDDAQIERMQAGAAREDLAIADRAGFLFALGKAFEDRASFEEAFTHYARGNALKSAAEPYDMDGFLGVIEKLKARADRTDYKRRPATTGPTPIFIVGLPRSGSTLLEQILASHSQVEGTMELPQILNYVREMAAGPGYPEALDALDEAGFQALGQRYLDETASYHGDAPYFIDKMPNNFLHIGLIVRALPQAIVIDARRDPRDSCFSIFKQNFARGQLFSYDLDVLGRYSLAYTDLMAHWSTLLPGRILRMQYEDVVANSDTEIARLLEHCGLPFEPACLRFYENDRAVRTASSEQVRQPIYSSSVGHWKHFERQLQPLISALGEAQPSTP